MSTVTETTRKRSRRNFTDEFKANAVRLVLDEGKSVGAAARDLDLTESSLRNWVERARADRGKGRPDVLTSAEREELGLLRRENRELRTEREILKNFRGPGEAVPPAGRETLQAATIESAPGGVAASLLVSSRTRKKTWSGGDLRT
jgi:transposase